MKTITMLRFLLLISLSALGTMALGQQEKNDPKATASLERLTSYYHKLSSFELGYELTIQYPEQEKEVQRGKLIRQGSSFRLDGDEQEVVCDGKTIWVYIKVLDEVQIMDATDASMASLLDPGQFLEEFVDDQFIYATVFEGNEGGKNIRKIEFKPVDPSSEYAKLRLSANQNDQEILSMEVFNKDGSRFSLHFGPFRTNTTVPVGTFTFDTGKYPGAHIEDLRM